MQTCYHCRRPVPTGVDIHADIAGSRTFFCCHACLAVAQIIAEHQLEQYYRVRERAAPRPENRFDFTHWQAYDLPEIAGQYVYHEGEDNEIHLYIDGLHCAACSWLIAKALKTRLGIEHSRINLSTGRAEIRWQKQPLSKILAVIAELGYTPHLYTPEQADKQQEKGRNADLLRLIVAGLGMMQVMMFATGLYSGDFLGIEGRYSALLRWISLLCTTPVLLYSGQPFFRNAWTGLKQGHLNMDLPIALATGGAYLASVYHTLLGKGEIYFDSVTMFIFFLSISRLLEAQTRRRARLNQHRFARLLPDAVYKYDNQRQIRLVPLAVIQPNDIIRVLPTHTIPVDGQIITGTSRVDESMLSGESTPIYKMPGASVLAGSTNLQSPLDIRVSQTGQQTTLAAIRRISARAEQSRGMQIDRTEKLAQWTIFIVLLLAGLGYFIWQWIEPARAFDIALAVLVATCPCALSLATPAVLTAALNHAHKYGILIKNGCTLERLQKIKTIVFDKTGTLTQGHYHLIAYESQYPDRQYLCQIAKSLETHSTHPVAWYFSRQEGEVLSFSDISHAEQGISGTYDNKRWHIGSAAFMREQGIQIPPIQGNGNPVYLAENHTLRALFLLDDPVRAHLAETLAQLRQFRLVIASGDRPDNVARLAQAYEISEYRGALSPTDKLKYLQQLHPDSALMIGDGINDAPVLARAAVSVAVGRANPLSQTHADIVFLHHAPEALPFLFQLARATQRIIHQNLFWALGYNLTVIPLALIGCLTPWLAALGMSISSLLVVGNALRIRRILPPPEVVAPLPYE